MSIHRGVARVGLRLMQLPRPGDQHVVGIGIGDRLQFSDDIADFGTVARVDLEETIVIPTRRKDDLGLPAAL